MKRKLAGALSVLLCLAACTPKEMPPAPVYESSFEEVLADLMPDEELRQKLSGSICIPEETLSDGQIRLLGTVGDRMALHLVVEVTFSEPGTVTEDFSAIPSVKMYDGQPEEGQSPQTLPGMASGACQVQSMGKDTEKNCATYSIMLENDRGRIQGEKTLVLSDFHSDWSEVPLEEPMHFISWTVENTADVLDLTLKTAAGEAVGEMTLTPFMVYINIPSLSKAGLAQKDFGTKLRVLRKDGSEDVAYGRAGGGFGGDTAKWAITFSAAQDLDQITAVLLGECKAELP